MLNLTPIHAISDSGGILASGAANVVCRGTSMQLVTTDPLVGNDALNGVCSTWHSILYTFTNISSFSQTLKFFILKGSSLSSLNSNGATLQLATNDGPDATLAQDKLAHTLTLLPWETQTVSIFTSCSGIDCTAASRTCTGHDCSKVANGTFKVVFGSPQIVKNNCGTPAFPAQLCIHQESFLTVRIEIDEPQGAVVGTINGDFGSAGGRMDLSKNIPNQVAILGGHAF